MIQKEYRDRGFSLIETIVYLALYALLITGAFSGFYALTESANRDETISLIEEEGNFLSEKIDWILANTASVQSPLVEGPILSVTRSDGTAATIFEADSDMQIQENTSPKIGLNTHAISVSKLVFISRGPNVVPGSIESIEADFTLSATTATGERMSRDFSTIWYLQK